LFGSVFSREDVIPALWLRPMEHPVTVLLAALGGGVAVLLIGLLLDGIQAHWRGAAQRWWGCRVGLPIAYVGLLYAPFDLSALLVAGLGAAWYMLGAVALAKGRRFTSIGPAAAEFFEESLRLLVNTVSFARVGAFALAHAGLSFAVVEVAAAAGPVGYWIVLALGNVLIIALDGLVVSIQAARLMLFEFFIHFLTARGREFMPLPPPDFATRGTQRQSLGSMS
jgi:V/A-type H+-transporting ATPase subunit I